MFKELSVLFIVCFALTFFLMPLFIKFAKRFKLMDLPGGRKIHTRPTPTLGGAVIYLSFMLGIWMSLRLSCVFQSTFGQYIPGLLVGGTVILLLGIFHDTIDMRPEAKLMGQVIAALVIFINGIRIEAITNPFGGLINVPQGLSMVLTVLWVIAVINAVNLIDGLDGLAGGITFISSAVLFFIALRRQDVASMFIIVALSGSILAFLRYNFHPARIFMGDTGSMFLGFTLSIISILGINKMATTVALLVPITALGIPIYDTALAIFRRVVLGKNVMASDRKHLHYRLLDMGLTHKQVVLFLYAVAVYFGLISFLLVLIPIEYALLLLILLGIGVFLGMRAIGFIETKLRATPRK